jgi:hypothetical protein
MQRLSIGINIHIQRGFGDIDADKLLGNDFTHFSHPILAKYGLGAQATVRVQGEKTGWMLLALSRNHLCSKGATNYPAGPVKRVESIRFGLQGEHTRVRVMRTCSSSCVFTT